VTLALSSRLLFSKDRATRVWQKNHDISDAYMNGYQIAGHDRGPLFCPAARFAVLEPLQTGDRLIASREYGLY
jgi:hypothetical protein